MKRASREPGLLKTYLTPDAASCSTMIWDGFAVMGLLELWELVAMWSWTFGCRLGLYVTRKWRAPFR